MKYILLGMGGAIGTIGRFLLTTAFPSTTFPWGTLSVNLIGCAIIGFLAGLNSNDFFSESLRMFLFIGLLGGFTTFSAFALETIVMLRSGLYFTAVMYIMASNIAGIGVGIAGYFFGRAVNV